jgi:hypothetical protein
MHLFAMVYVFIALIVIVVPMFLCSYPEEFTHNVNHEFRADNLYEKMIKMKREEKHKVKPEAEMAPVEVKE